MKIVSTGWILITGLVLTLVIFFSALVFSIFKMDTIRKDIHYITEENNRKTELIVIMYTSARERVLGLYRMLDTTDPFIRDDIYQEFNRNGTAFAGAREELIDLPLDKREKILLDEQGELAAIVVPQLMNLISKIQEEQIISAREILNKHSINVQAKLLEKLDYLLQYQQEKSAKRVELTDKKFNENRQLILTWATFALLSGLVIAFFVIHGIRASEKKLYIQIGQTKATLSSISDGVITIEEDGFIKYMNKAATKFLGDLPRQSAIWDAIRFLNPEYKQTFIQMLRMSVEKDAVNLGQYEISSNGKQCWMDIFRSPVFDQMNQLIGIVIVLRDVTELKESQLALTRSNESLERRVEERTRDIKQANTKLEESIYKLKHTQEQLIQTEKMAALGGLVAGISHEINTPIGTSVTSASSIEESFKAIEKAYNSDSLSQDNFSAHLDHTREGLDILNKNLRRASELIRSFKRVAVDQTSEEWREINLGKYTNEIITSLNPRLKSTGIQIDNHIPDNFKIYTNPGAIYQVISNLILNSIIHGFTDQPKAVDNTLASPTITISATIEDNLLHLTYKDNGNGMDTKLLAKVFDPFFTTKRGQGGSGLGMNIVYNSITSQLKGRVRADSKPGIGFLVEMKIPFATHLEENHESKFQSII